MKNARKKQLSKLILVDNSRGIPGKNKLEVAGHVVATARKQAVIIACVQLVYSFLFILGPHLMR